MEHFAFPGNIDFAADDQGIFIMQGWWLQGWCVYSSMKQCLQSVNLEQFPIQMTQNNKHYKWLEILDFQPKLLCRTPTKIHCERRRRRQQEAAREAQKTSLNSTAKATSSTERPQTCTEAVTKYCNYTANGADEEREHRLTMLQKAIRRSGNAYWVYSKIIFFNATIGSNSYTICTMHVKNIFPTDWGQPTSLYTMSNIGFYSKLYFTMNSL